MTLRICADGVWLRAGSVGTASIQVVGIGKAIGGVVGVDLDL